VLGNQAILILQKHFVAVANVGNLFRDEICLRLKIKESIEKLSAGERSDV
jgi:hypothetical protein